MLESLPEKTYELTIISSLEIILVVEAVFSAHQTRILLLASSVTIQAIARLLLETTTAARFLETSQHRQEARFSETQQAATVEAASSETTIKTTRPSPLVSETTPLTTLVVVSSPTIAPAILEEEVSSETIPRTRILAVVSLGTTTRRLHLATIPAGLFLATTTPTATLAVASSETTTPTSPPVEVSLETRTQATREADFSAIPTIQVIRVEGFLETTMLTNQRAVVFSAIPPPLRVQADYSEIRISQLEARLSALETLRQPLVVEVSLATPTTPVAVDCSVTTRRTNRQLEVFSAIQLRAARSLATIRLRIQLMRSLLNSPLQLSTSMKHFGSLFRTHTETRPSSETLLLIKVLGSLEIRKLHGICSEVARTTSTCFAFSSKSCIATCIQSHKQTNSICSKASSGKRVHDLFTNETVFSSNEQTTDRFSLVLKKKRTLRSTALSSVQRNR